MLGPPGNDSPNSPMPATAGPATVGGLVPVMPPPAQGTGGGMASAPPSSGAAGGGDPVAPAGGGDPVAPPPLPDGDPNGSGPVVTIPDARCGPTIGLADGFVDGSGIPGPGAPNIKIGGRDVVLSYPCDKQAGAHVTFILNLHGTMPLEELKFYQHGYFSAHKHVNTHSLIVATPKSVASTGQWGNQDGGEDLPHLYEVIDWVYSKFSDFKITGMWVAGHSWGSMYAKNFVCDAMLADKVRGVIGQSGGPTLAGAGLGGALGGGGGGGCAARISQIHTVGDAEGGEAGVPDQSSVATPHGCAGRSMPRDIGDGQMLYEWPNCDPGWVHFNFVMGAHEHITAINDNVVLHILEAIKSTEQS